MKKILSVFSAALLLAGLCACSSQSSGNTLPEKHAIPYDETLETLNDDYGADSYGGCLDKADSRYYTVNDYYNMKSDETLHILSNFETYQQTKEYTCGCSALLMVLHYYGIDEYNELQLGALAGTAEGTGTTPEGMRRALDTLGFDYEHHTGTDKVFDYASAEEYFIGCIDNGMPVMVDWVDWGGHWAVVIGIDTCGTDLTDDDVIIFADPYDVTDGYQDGYYIFSYERFITMWREGACVGKAAPYEQPYVTVLK